jgi:hypothetical protein
MGKQFFGSFLCGVFGGAAPLLIELAGRAKLEQMPSSGYYVAMVVLAFIGGVIAVVYKEEVAHKAFLLGVSAPALIAAAGSAADQVPKPLWFLPTLYAAEQVGTAPSNATRVLFVAPDSKVFDPLSVEGDVVVKVDGNWQRIHLNLKRDDRAAAAIPSAATSVYFEGSVAPRERSDRSPVLIRTEPVELMAGKDPLMLTFASGQQTFVGGLLDGFGMKRSAQQYIQYSARVETAKAR